MIQQINIFGQAISPVGDISKTVDRVVHKFPKAKLAKIVVECAEEWGMTFPLSKGNFIEL